MLVLSCKIGTGVVIGNNLRVVILEVRNTNVRLGFITKDKELSILRDGLHYDKYGSCPELSLPFQLKAKGNHAQSPKNIH